MIIFGTRVRRNVVESRPFLCPTCDSEQIGVHETAKRYFTLFFIPIIPMDTVGEVVTCRNCYTQYRPEVLAMSKRKQKPKNDEIV